MPPIERKEAGWAGWVVVALFAGAVITFLVWATLEAPALTWVFGPAAALYGLLMIRSHRYWRAIKQQRRAETICTFARALPARGRDTWIVRAVYEELSFDRGVSVRPADRLERDLGFLPEDISICLERAAARVGRSAIATEKNPLFGRVSTVADAVAFLEFQPTAESANR